MVTGTEHETAPGRGQSPPRRVGAPKGQRTKVRGRPEGSTVGSQKERMLAGESYITDEPELAADLRGAAELS